MVEGVAILRKGLWRTHHVCCMMSVLACSCCCTRPSLRNVSLALVILTLQVCLPTTGTRTKASGLVL